LAKGDLIGGSLWDHYSNKVAERMDNPTMRGELTEEDALKLNGKLVVADYGAESCGDAVRLYWIVSPEGKILDAKFKSFGCGTAIAASDMMTEMTIGKTVDEAVKITNIDVERALRDKADEPAVPPQKMHCSVMAYDAIKEAAAVYYGKNKEDFDDMEMVCECAQVRLRDIKDAIRINDLKTVEEITLYTKAGAFCKSCVKPGGHEEKKYYLVDILAETRAEMEREQAGSSRSQAELPFDELSAFQKGKKIEEYLDSEILPFLARDGGSASIADFKEKDGRFIVYLNFLGACNGCAGASMGTRFAIQSALQSDLSPLIDVELA
jgi:NifU-like protein